MDKPKKEKKKSQGNVVIGKKGEIIRFKPQGEMSGRNLYSRQTLDTTGYSAGKKNFTIKESLIPGMGRGAEGMTLMKTQENPSTPVSRKEVKKTIKELKKGADKTIDLREKPQKKIVEIIKNVAASVKKKKQQRKSKKSWGKGDYTF
jgi:hypothetical protein